jgi:hypothetical protein
MKAASVTDTAISQGLYAGFQAASEWAVVVLAGLI